MPHVVKIQFRDVAARFEAILSGALSRDEADRWAWRMMQHEDNDDLEYLPTDDEERIWSGLTYIFGVNLQDGPPGLDGAPCYLHSAEDIYSAFNSIEAGQDV